MSKTKIPRISKVVREENLIEDSLAVIRVIRSDWFEAKHNYGDVIKSKACYVIKSELFFKP